MKAFMNFIHSVRVVKTTVIGINRRRLAECSVENFKK